MCPLSIDRPRIHLCAYAPGDQDRFAPRADFGAEKQNCNHDWRYGPPGPIWTARADKRVIGVAGLAWLGDGEWQCWAWLADVDRRTIVQLLRLAKQEIAATRTVAYAKRFIAHARADFPAARACLEKIGFTVTGETLEASTGVYDVMERHAYRKEGA